MKFNFKDIITCVTSLGDQSFVRYCPNSNLLRFHVTAFVTVIKNKNDTNFPPKDKISTYFWNCHFAKRFNCNLKWKIFGMRLVFVKLSEIILINENIKKWQKIRIAL